MLYCGKDYPETRCKGGEFCDPGLHHCKPCSAICRPHSLARCRAYCPGYSERPWSTTSAITTTHAIKILTPTSSPTGKSSAIDVFHKQPFLIGLTTSTLVLSIILMTFIVMMVRNAKRRRGRRKMARGTRQACNVETGTEMVELSRFGQYMQGVRESVRGYDQSQAMDDNCGAPGSVLDQTSAESVADELEALASQLRHKIHEPNNTNKDKCRGNVSDGTKDDDCSAYQSKQETREPLLSDGASGHAFQQQSKERPKPSTSTRDGLQPHQHGVQPSNDNSAVTSSTALASGRLPHNNHASTPDTSFTHSQRNTDRSAAPELELSLRSNGSVGQVSGGVREGEEGVPERASGFVSFEGNNAIQSSELNLRSNYSARAERPAAAEAAASSAFYFDDAVAKLRQNSKSIPGVRFRAVTMYRDYIELFIAIDGADVKIEDVVAKVLKLTGLTTNRLTVTCGNPPIG